MGRQGQGLQRIRGSLSKHIGSDPQQGPAPKDAEGKTYIVIGGEHKGHRVRCVTAQPYWQMCSVEFLDASVLAYIVDEDGNLITDSAGAIQREMKPIHANIWFGYLREEG